VAIVDVAAQLRVPFEKLTNESQFSEWFAQTAEFLMNQCLVYVNKQPHRLAELEFYVFCDTHRDPFPHMNADQLQPASWYFHKHGNSYRGGTYKGLDVTCGGGKSGLFGGILIRSLESLVGGATTATLVNGPCKCVDHILQLCGASSIATFVEQSLKTDLSCAAAHSPLRIVADDGILRSRVIHRSIRVGLQPTKAGVDPEVQLRMLFQPYRFLIADKRIAKGRPHLVGELLRTGRPRADIAALSFCTPSKIGELIAAFEAGKAGAAASLADVARRYAGRKLESDAEILTALAQFTAAT